MKVRHIDGKQDDNENVEDLFLQHDMPFNTIINAGEGSGNVGIGTVHTNEKLTVGGNIQVLGNKILIYGPGDPTYSDVLLSLGNSTPNTGEIWGLFSKGVDGTFNIGKAYVAATLTITPSENVGIGTTNPSERLEVEGYVKAYGFNTGDIIFRKDDKPVWRMYEDEKGLYVQSLTTDKKYTLVLEEIGDAGGVSEVATNGVGDKIQQLQEKNKALEARLAKIESLLNARQ